ncbi:glycosyltransferase [Sphingobacterium sp. NPDC055431]
MSNKTCLIYNFGQHYRLGIFKLIDQEIGCDFYFGNKMDDVRKLNYAELTGFKKELKNISLFSNFYWQEGAVKILFNREYKNYIILGDYYCLSTWVILVLNVFFRKNVFLWTHGWYGKETLIVSAIKKTFFSMAGKILLYGEYAKRLMMIKGFKSDKLKVIYNSLDYINQKVIRESLFAESIYKNYFLNNNPTILFIGRLTKVKQLHLIFHAQKKMFMEKNFPINVVVIGEGDEKNNLLNIVNELDLNSYTWFTGKLYDEKSIAKYIFNSDLCVSPGNVGLTAIHSLMYGTPIVTHNDFSYQMPEFEAIVEHQTGLFFEKNNVDSLADAIYKWFQIKHSREDVRKNCFNIIDEKFNPLYQIKILKNVIGTNDETID